MSFLFYSSLLIMRMLGIYLCLCLTISIFMSLINKRKSPMVRKLVLNAKLSLISLILLFVFAYVRQGFFQSYTAWGPEFSKEDIVGKWEKGGRVLMFQEDGHLIEKINDHAAQNGIDYSWGFTKSVSKRITIEAETGGPVKVLRVIRFCNELRLLEKYEQAPVLMDLGYRNMKK